MANSGASCKESEIALRVEKLGFARPSVCALHFDEYKKLPVD